MRFRSGDLVTVEFIDNWNWAEDGVYVHGFLTGDRWPVPRRCAELAIALGKAKRVGPEPINEPGQLNVPVKEEDSIKPTRKRSRRSKVKP